MQIDCRIDDKLSRLARGSEFPGDDTVLDLAGYLILRRIVSVKIKSSIELIEKSETAKVSC